MNHLEFLSKWKGKFYRESGIPSAECVALAKLYAQEVQGIHLPSFGGSARSGWLGSTYDPRYWVRTNNTPKAIPKQGSHIFFDIGQYGHVAIVNDATGDKITLLEQNASGESGDAKGDEIKLSTYPYTKCLGWFTLKYPEAIGGSEAPGLTESLPHMDVPAPTLAPNRFKTIANYKQTINGECSFFAAGSVITYNTGKIFKNLLLHNIWTTYCTPSDPSYPPLGAARIMAKDYHYNLAPLKGIEAEKLLDLGYGCVISIVAPTMMIVDGIRDGNIDGDYSPDLSQSHAIMLIKDKGEYFLVNSLGQYATGNTFNTYKIRKELLQKMMKGSNYYFIY